MTFSSFFRKTYATSQKSDLPWAIIRGWAIISQNNFRLGHNLSWAIIRVWALNWHFTVITFFCAKNSNFRRKKISNFLGLKNLRKNYCLESLAVKLSKKIVKMLTTLKYWFLKKLSKSKVLSKLTFLTKIWLFECVNENSPFCKCDLA